MTERNIMCDEIQRNSNAVVGININETDYFRPTPEVSLAKWSYLQLSYRVMVLELVHNVAIVLFQWKKDVVSGYVVWRIAEQNGKK